MFDSGLVTGLHRSVRRLGTKGRQTIDVAIIRTPSYVGINVNGLGAAVGVARGRSWGKLTGGVRDTVLELAHIGRQDNFFVVSGYPLLALKPIVRVMESFGSELPVFAVFEYPTVLDMAEYIREHKSTCSAR